MEGLKDDFKVNDNLQAFQNHLWVHLEETGMDTITCVPDPDTNEMVNVVLDPARFTMDMVAIKIAPMTYQMIKLLDPVFWKLWSTVFAEIWKKSLKSPTLFL